MRFTFQDPAPANAECYKTLKIQRIAGTPDGKCFAKAWRGKQGKPYAYYSFRDAERRETWITEQKAAEDAREAWQEQRAKTKDEAARKYEAEIQVGTILHGSWGYDQTNAELYKVVEKRGKVVWLQPCVCETVRATGPMAEEIRPTDKVTGEKIKRLITANGVKLHECCHLRPTTKDASHYSSWYA